MPPFDPQPSLAKKFKALLLGPQILAFLPALCLAAYWLIGEGGLIVAALGLPVLWGLFGGFEQPAEHEADSGASKNDDISWIVSGVIKTAKANERMALFALTIDDREDLCTRLAMEEATILQKVITSRLETAVRSHDRVELTGLFNWLIAISPGHNLDLEAAIQQASRLQAALDEVFVIGNDRLYLTACIGFTISAAPCEAAPVLLAQAHSALATAQSSGPDAIRAYSKDHVQHLAAPAAMTQDALVGDIDSCLKAWFQPQISTDTGQVCGFEALARWQQPDGLMLAPAVFLPKLEATAQMERLSSVMLAQSLKALVAWDKNGLEVETVGINVSQQDLSNPRFYDKVAWDLDKSSVAPHRLCIEVLESVVAGGSDDVIARNVRRLAELGCQIDLDDFGTGHASISTLRRLPITRLKIDRSFVARADLDPDQQKMVATIMMMADRLGLSCLAEGVETIGEHAILAQLGCKYVQGFGIAKPMPYEQTVAWIKEHQSKLAYPPRIGRKSS